MHSLTFVLIYGTIWRSWTWGSSPTWGVWSLNVIKDKTNPHTHIIHTNTDKHTFTNTQIHNYTHTWILTRLCNELQQKSRGSSWMGVGLMGVFGTTSHMCNMISSPSAKGLPLLIAKHGPCVGPLLHASWVKIPTKYKMCVWWESSIVSQSGGKILGHFRNKGFGGKGFRFGREWLNKSF